MPTIYIKSGKEAPIRRKHPWVFEGAIHRMEGPPQPGEAVDVRDMAAHLAALAGRDVRFLESPDGMTQFRLDATRRRELAGPCRVDWREGMRRLVTARHPELLRTPPA